MTDDVKSKIPALIAELDPDDLAVILMSIGAGIRRTDAEKRSSREIIAASKKMWPAGFGAFPFEHMAHAAIHWFAEQLNAGSRPQ